MVALTPRFTLLAAFCSLAAISLSPTSVNAAVIQARHSDPTSKNDPPAPPSSSSKKPVRQRTPVLALPANAIKAGNAKTKAKSPSEDKEDEEKHKSKMSHKARIAEWDPPNAVLSFGIFDSLYKSKRQGDSGDLLGVRLPPLDVQVAKRHHPNQAYFHHSHPEVDVVVKGSHPHVHVSRDHDQHHHHHHHHYDEHEKIIIEGKDAHVHVGRRSPSLATPNDHGPSLIVPKSHSRRSPHHRHDHHEHKTVIIEGKDSHVHIHRRSSSLTIPNDRGGSYVVSHSNSRRSPRHRHHRHRHGVVIKDRDTHVRRDQDGVPGTVDIMSAQPNSPNGIRIASLFLDTSNDTSYFLNASDKNKTELHLVAVPSSPTTPKSNCTFVSLQMALSDPKKAAMVPYCATFYASPVGAEPLTMTPCLNGTGEPLSQVFCYDAESGIVKPMSFKESENGSESNDGDEGGNGDGDEDNGAEENGTEQDQDSDMPEAEGVANVMDAGATLGRRTDGEGHAQNVTLMFRPSGPEVVAVADVDVESTAMTGTTIGTTTTSTATETTTIIVTSTSVDVPSSVMGNASLSAAGLESTESASFSTSTSSLTSGTTSTSMDASSASSAVGVLNVEVLGPSGSVTSTTSASSSPSVPTPTLGSDTAARSIDAEAVASAIAAGHDASNSGSSSVATSMTSTSMSPTGGVVGTVYVPAAAPAGSPAVPAVDLKTSGLKMRMAAGPRMTPVETEPYQWMFRADSRL